MEIRKRKRGAVKGVLSRRTIWYCVVSIPGGKDEVEREKKKSREEKVAYIRTGQMDHGYGQLPYTHPTTTLEIYTLLSDDSDDYNCL